MGGIHRQECLTCLAVFAALHAQARYHQASAVAPFMAPLIADPGLWQLTRRSVANAFSVGLFCAMLPIPCQMVAAALGARLTRCNLALAVGLVWITNPLTMPLFLR